MPQQVGGFGYKMNLIKHDLITNLSLSTHYFNIRWAMTLTPSPHVFNSQLGSLALITQPLQPENANCTGFRIQMRVGEVEEQHRKLFCGA